MRSSSLLPVILSIQTGQTDSSELDIDTFPNIVSLFARGIDFRIWAPDALTGIARIQSSWLTNPGSGDWRDEYVGGALLTIPANGVVTVPAGALFALRVKADTNQAALREFRITVQHSDA